MRGVLVKEGLYARREVGEGGRGQGGRGREGGMNARACMGMCFF